MMNLIKLSNDFEYQRALNKQYREQLKKIENKLLIQKNAN